MSKASIDTSTTEILIYKAVDAKEAMEIRSKLVAYSTGCWFFLYTSNNEIYATNEFGGRLKQEKAQDLIDFVKKLFDPS